MGKETARKMGRKTDKETGRKMGRKASKETD